MIFKFNKNIYDYKPEPCCSGESIGYNVTLSIDKDGQEILECEQYDLQAVIDSFSEGCSIQRILVAHGLGDDSVLNKKEGIYLDEDQVKVFKMANSNELEINTQLLTLYQGYKDSMTFTDFVKAVTTGNLEALNKKTVVEEEGDK